jgi:hypothetical protein
VESCELTSHSCSHLGLILRRTKGRTGQSLLPGQQHATHVRRIGGDPRSTSKTPPTPGTAQEACWFAYQVKDKLQALQVQCDRGQHLRFNRARQDPRSRRPSLFTADLPHSRTNGRTPPRIIGLSRRCHPTPSQPPSSDRNPAHRSTRPGPADAPESSITLGGLQRRRRPDTSRRLHTTIR